LALILVIGNKNYSSWSFRPWIAMKVAGIAFDEVVISLDAPDFKSRVSKIAGTGKVPALDDNGIHVWESLAILEYLPSGFPPLSCGRPTPPRGRRRGRSRRKCMRALCRSAAPAR
jgi:glutathione S-transferase